MPKKIKNNNKKNIPAPAEKNGKINGKNFFVVYKIYLIILLIILVIAAGIFLALKYFNKPILKINELSQSLINETKENNLMEGKTAIELGLDEAKKWHSDAELSYVLSADAGQLKGRSNNWQLIYVSPSAKGKGFLVKIVEAKISNTKEISYVGQAAIFPADAISQADAVAQVRAIPGFADIKVLGIELVYNTAAKTWYWGVRTDKGTASIVAAKETVNKK
jgi:hypothetical protein